MTKYLIALYGTEGDSMKCLTDFNNDILTTVNILTH